MPTRGDELQNAAGKKQLGVGIRAMALKAANLSRVAGVPIQDVCVPCYGLLQQKKLSQNYVPLRDAAKCVACGEKRVTGAYLAYCPRCAGERRVRLLLTRQAALSTPARPRHSGRSRGVPPLVVGLRPYAGRRRADRPCFLWGMVLRQCWDMRRWMECSFVFATTRA